jgi:hypothetical protein
MRLAQPHPGTLMGSPLFALGGAVLKATSFATMDPF